MCHITIFHNICTSLSYEVNFVGVSSISPLFAYISQAIAINQLNIEGVLILFGACHIALCIHQWREGFLVTEFSCCISLGDIKVSAPSFHKCSIHAIMYFLGFCQDCLISFLKPSRVYYTYIVCSLTFGAPISQPYSFKCQLCFNWHLTIGRALSITGVGGGHYPN
jgi:hypothetical protein